MPELVRKACRTDVHTPPDEKLVRFAQGAEEAEAGSEDAQPGPHLRFCSAVDAFDLKYGGFERN